MFGLNSSSIGSIIKAPAPQPPSSKTPSKKRLLWVSFTGAYALGAPLLGGAIFFWLVSTYPDQAQSLPALAVGISGALLVSSALLPSFLFAGYLGFVSTSFVSGVAYATLGIGLATALGILMFRRISPDAAETLLSFRPRWLASFRKIRAEKGRSLFAILFFARLSPHMPFAATNLVVAQASMRFVPAVLVSWIGLLPRSLIALSIGANLTSLGDLADSSLAKPLGWQNLATLGFVLLIAIYGYRKFKAIGRSSKKDQHLP